MIEATITSGQPVRPELTKRLNFTYRVKIDISASVKKPQVANFRTNGPTDRFYRTVFKVSLRPRSIDPNPCRESCVYRTPAAAQWGPGCTSDSKV